MEDAIQVCQVDRWIDFSSSISHFSSINKCVNDQFISIRKRRFIYGETRIRQSGSAIINHFHITISFVVNGMEYLNEAFWFFIVGIFFMNEVQQPEYDDLLKIKWNEGEVFRLQIYFYFICLSSFYIWAPLID